MTTRQTLKRNLPGPVVDAVTFLRRWRYWGSDARKRRLRHDFNARCAGLDPESLPLRPGLTIRCDPAARHGFEHFVHLDTDMVSELDDFIAVSRGAKCLIDIGALHGLFALTFAAINPGSKVLCVEPSPEALAILRKNIDLNGLADRVLVAPVACGAESGELEMVADWHHLMASSVYKGTARNIIKIPVYTLDELCREKGLEPDVVKIDVEGYEVGIEKGARRVLTDIKPTLALEIHPPQIRDLGTTAAAFVDQLASYGYEFVGHGLKPKSLADLKAQVTAAEREPVRVVAVHPRRQR